MLQTPHQARAHAAATQPIPPEYENTVVPVHDVWLGKPIPQADHTSIMLGYFFVRGPFTSWWNGETPKFYVAGNDPDIKKWPFRVDWQPATVEYHTLTVAEQPDLVTFKVTLPEGYPQKGLFAVSLKGVFHMQLHVPETSFAITDYPTTVWFHPNASTRSRELTHTTPADLARFKSEGHNVVASNTNNRSPDNTIVPMGFHRPWTAADGPRPYVPDEPFWARKAWRPWPPSLYGWPGDQGDPGPLGSAGEGANGWVKINLNPNFRVRGNNGSAGGEPHALGTVHHGKPDDSFRYLMIFADDPTSWAAKPLTRECDGVIRPVEYQ